MVLTFVKLLKWYNCLENCWKYRLEMWVRHRIVSVNRAIYSVDCKGKHRLLCSCLHIGKLRGHITAEWWWGGAEAGRRREFIVPLPLSFSYNKADFCSLAFFDFLLLPVPRDYYNLENYCFMLWNIHWTRGQFCVQRLNFL